MDIRQDEQQAAAVIQRIRSMLQRNKLRSEVVAVEGLILQVAKLLQAEFKTRSATLQIDVLPDLRKVWGDHVYLQQVIRNLLLNSLDALEGQPEDRRRLAAGEWTPGTGWSS